MPKLIVRGYSDDIVTFEGDFHEEEYPDTDGFVVVVSDGTVLTGSYGVGDGAFWRFNRIKVGSGDYSKFEAVDDEGSDYSDIVTIEGDDVTWAAITNRIVKAKK